MGVRQIRSVGQFVAVPVQRVVAKSQIPPDQTFPEVLVIETVERVVDIPVIKGFEVPQIERVVEIPQIAMVPGELPRQWKEPGWGRRLSRGSSGRSVGEETRFAGSGWSVGEEMRFADPQGVRHALSARGLVVELCCVSSCALLT